MKTNMTSSLVGSSDGPFFHTKLSHARAAKLRNIPYGRRTNHGIGDGPVIVY